MRLRDGDSAGENVHQIARLFLQPQNDRPVQRRRRWCNRRRFFFWSLSVAVLLALLFAVYFLSKYRLRRGIVSKGMATMHSWILRAAKEQTKWTAEYNPNAFDVEELNFSNIEVRRDETYLLTAFHSEYDRSYSQTFYSRDHYSFVVNMLKNVTIPPSYSARFDARDRWPHCRNIIARVYDQGACWHYWLFSTQSTIEDRICVASNGEMNVKLSKSHVLMCCPECGGCRGGSPEAVYMFWVTQGITTESCQPSTLLLSEVLSECGSPCPLSATKNADRTLRLRTPPCNSECLTENLQFIDAHKDPHHNTHYGDYVNLIQKSVISERKARVLGGGEIIRGRISIGDTEWLDLVKKELFLRGPVSIDFIVREDFLLYKAGIYEPLVNDSNHKLFRYHVKVIGWELLNNETIFVAANSWGHQWGEEGLFRFPARILTETGQQPHAFAPFIVQG